MSLVLFLQIEVILLTLGLVLTFVNSMNQMAKDNSWMKKSRAIGEALNRIAKEIVEKKKEEKA